MATPQDPYAFEWCEVRRWRGYVKSTFYAVTDTGEVVAESRPFRWRKAEPPPQTPSARAAYDALVAAVVADGWTSADEPARTWYGTRFTRPRRVPLVPRVVAPAFEAAPVPAPLPAPWPYELPAPEPPAVAAPRAPEPAPPEPEEAPVEQLPLRHRHRRTFAIAGGAVAIVAVAAAALPATHRAVPHSPTAAAAQEHVKTKAKPKAAAVHHEVTAAKPVAATSPTKPSPPLVDLRITAHGNGSWIELRRRSKKGPELYRGTLAAGKHLHFRGARLWASFGAAGNLSIVADGRPVELRGTFDKLFTP